MSQRGVSMAGKAFLAWLPQAHVVSGWVTLHSMPTTGSVGSSGKRDTATAPSPAPPCLEGVH